MVDAQRPQGFHHAGGVRPRICRARHRHRQGRPVQAGVPEDQPQQPHPRDHRPRNGALAVRIGRHPDVSRGEDRQILAQGPRRTLAHHAVADVADGRRGPDVRPGAPLREVQPGQGALCGGALSEGGAPALRRARPAARGGGIPGGPLFDCRHGHLAVGVALRVADRRPQPVRQCGTLVQSDRCAARGAEGLPCSGQAARHSRCRREASIKPRRGSSWTSKPDSQALSPRC